MADGELPSMEFAGHAEEAAAGGDIFVEDKGELAKFFGRGRGVVGRRGVVVAAVKLGERGVEAAVDLVAGAPGLANIVDGVVDFRIGL